MSQPGQYVCKERITVAGPKGLFQNVVISGPERKEAQVEVSMTDTRILGINAPVRESGKIEGTPGVTLMNGATTVSLDGKNNSGKTTHPYDTRRCPSKQCD